MDDNLNMSMEESQLVDEFSGLFDDEAPAEVETPEIDDGYDAEDYEESDEDIEEDTEEDEEAEDEIETVDPEGLFAIKIGDEVSHISVKDLSESYLDAESRKAEWVKVDNAKQEALVQARDLITGLTLSKLETDLILKEYDSTDWNSLSPEEFKTRKMNESNLKQKATAIQNQLNLHKQNIEQEENRVKANKINAARTQLEREVAGFSGELYSNALQHAVTVLGVDKDTAINLLDAGLLKLVIKDYQEHVAPTKKTPKMPRKSVKTKAKVEKDFSNIRGDADLLALGEALF